MLFSMTGFGRAESRLASSGGVTVEIRSVNHRFLETEVRLPNGLQSFEEEIRRRVGTEVRRGQVRVFVTLRETAVHYPAAIQTDLARRYVTQLRRLQKQLRLNGPLGLETILALPQVISTAEKTIPATRQWSSVERTIEQALARMLQMRRREGARLKEALQRITRALETLARNIRRRIPEFEKESQRRLAERIEALLQSVGQNPASGHDAVLAEAASIVSGSDVSEEMDRLDSHFLALRNLLSGGKPAGRKRAATGKELAGSPGRTIDFLVQEMQREVNTLGSKLRDGEVLRDVVAMKGQLEKLREQAANLE